MEVSEISAMRVMSNAFFSQAEVTQVDRWEHGQLEIHLVPEPHDRQGFRNAEFGGLIVNWNCKQCAGFLRDAQCLEQLQSRGLVAGSNPNLVFAPTHCGYTELLGMLGSLLPDKVLKGHKIDRPEANFWLWPSSEELRFRSPAKLDEYSLEEVNRLTDAHLQRLASIIPNAFEQWIWTQLVRSKRFGFQDFAENERASFRLTRPRMGGDLWEPDNADDRQWITGLLIGGDSTFQSLEPIVDVLLGSAAHEDFSNRYSWIKEDFERAFYSKRSRVKVKLYEYVDECPVHEGVETPGYKTFCFAT